MRRRRRGKATTIGIRNGFSLMWLRPPSFPKNRNHQNVADATEIIPEIIGGFNDLIPLSLRE